MAQSPETLDALFVNLVMIFKTAAFQQMGKTLNPITGKIEKNLEQARFSIDMIEMLMEKTRGNLSDDLNKFMDSTLLELRMNYVEEAKAQAGQGTGGEAAAAGEKAAKAEPAEGKGDKAGTAEEKGDKAESAKAETAEEKASGSGSTGSDGSAKAADEPDGGENAPGPEKDQK